MSQHDLIVVGAGLTGLFAGTLAAQRGLRTLVIARGVGGTHVGAGCIDVHVAASLDEFIAAGADHPYALAGGDSLRAALDDFKAVCDAAGYPMRGSLGDNLLLPTAVGAARPTCLAPETMTAGDLRRPGAIALATFPGLRDFYPQFAAPNLQTQISDHPVACLTLPLPSRPTRRDSYAADLARLLDDDSFRAKAIKEWKREVEVQRLGLPAVLGLHRAPAVRRDLAAGLGLDVFEIPILPPSVPGMRLFNILRAALAEAGGRLILGPEVAGLSEKKRVVGVIAHTAGGPREHRADAVLLATGGFLNGGLVAEQSGRVREPVCDLPIAAPPRAEWFRPEFLGPHPFARFGVRVNSDMQPVDPSGDVIFENLYAAGSLLAGADRLSEGSREGICLATAYKAINSLH